MAIVIHPGQSKGCQRLETEMQEGGQDVHCLDSAAMDLHFAHTLARQSRTHFKPVQRIFREISMHEIVRNTCLESRNAMIPASVESGMRIWPGMGAFRQASLLQGGIPQPV
ncbi:MAG: hypothetical protein H7833_19515 [Magnetococcus sp. DMHC-1]|nr:hypothetical protein [Magnetococcales bacterium]